MKNAKIKMVEITSKPASLREAIAEGKIYLKKSTIEQIRNQTIQKGDPIQAAELAGIMAVKQTSQLIPLCHPLSITHIKININLEENFVRVRCAVKSIGQTGVEMEALTGVSIALLTIWDMTKPLEKDDQGQYPTTSITEIKVIEKKKRDFKSL
ncbi:MAG: cyclic pyranopterin monophosphate synthase MoaC [Candidatus Helarchaeota archaeon]